MISAEHLQDLAAFPVRTFVQDVGRFGVDLHSYTKHQLQLCDMIKASSLAETQGTQRVFIMLI